MKHFAYFTECHKLLDRKMHWETSPDNFEQLMSDSLSRDTFERILRNLILVTTNKGNPRSSVP